MRIILAAPRGFCAGVNMAIESLEKAVALYGTPIYVYHEIVHNSWVVEHFRGKKRHASYCHFPPICIFNGCISILAFDLSTVEAVIIEAH